MNNPRFLKALLGDDCASALVEAVQRTPGLEAALTPRAMVAWLAALGPRYSGPIPGLDGSLSFERTDGLYKGEVVVGDQTYSYRGAPGLEVAALLAVAAGDGDMEPAKVRAKDLARLGKSLDKMVGAVLENQHRELVRTYLAKADKTTTTMYCSRCKDPLDEKGHCKIKAHWAELDKIEPKGVTAKPAGPVEPTGQTGAQGPQAPQKQARQTASASSVPGVTTSLTPPKGKTLKMEKHQASRPCDGCGQLRFSEGRFVGCPCFSELAKNVTTLLVGAHYLLKFSPEADAEAYTALAMSVSGDR